jgi:hypothetical protein
MDHFPESNDSRSDEEFLVAPPFTTIGLSIPSISWLNKQLQSDGDGPGDGPGVRDEKEDFRREQPQDAGDALSQAHSRSESHFSTAARGSKRQTAQ